MKILFCTDGSTCSYNALNDILKFVSYDVTFDVINVIDTRFFPWNIEFSQKELQESYTKQADNILEEAKKVIEDKGFSVGQKEAKHGDIAHTIIEKIQSDGYELVVMGSHGKKGFKKWIGSVSKKVVSKSNIPVFVSGTKKPPISAQKNYLILVDGSKCSFAAINKAVQFFNFDNSNTTMLTVKSGLEIFPVEITMDPAWLEACLKKQQELAEEILENSSKILQTNGIIFDKKILEGNIAEQILDYLSNNDVSMVIMGSHGREGLSEYLLGSISKRILDNAEIPVFIVPIKI